jgi:hypothetical protein
MGMYKNPGIEVCLLTHRLRTIPAAVILTNSSQLINDERAILLYLVSTDTGCLI